MAWAVCREARSDLMALAVFVRFLLETDFIQPGFKGPANMAGSGDNVNLTDLFNLDGTFLSESRAEGGSQGMAPGKRAPVLASGISPNGWFHARIIRNPGYNPHGNRIIGSCQSIN